MGEVPVKPNTEHCQISDSRPDAEIRRKPPRATVTRHNRFTSTEIRDTSLNDLAGETRLEYKVLTIIPVLEAGYGLMIDDRQRREQWMT